MKQGLTKSFLGVGALKVAGLPLGLLVSILLARALGPEQFGEYSFVMALIPLLALPSTAGLGHLLTRQVAQYKLESHWHLYRGISISSHFWVITTSATTIICIAGARQFFPELMSEKRWQLLSLASLLIPILGLDTIRSGLMRGLSSPVYAQTSDLILKPFFVLASLSIIALTSSINAKTAIGVQITSGLISMTFASILLARIQPSLSDTDREYETGSWMMSLVPLGIVAAMYTINTNIGIVLLGHLGTSEDIAGMRVAERGSQFVFLSLSIMNLVIGPEIVKQLKNNDTRALQKLATSSARGALAIAIPIAGTLLVFGKPIINTLYGMKYSELAYVPLVILVLGQLVNVTCGPVGNILAMSGLERKSVIAHTLAIIANTILCLILIPRHGAVGAAIAASASLMIWNIILAAFVVKYVRIKPFAI